MDRISFIDSAGVEYTLHEDSGAFVTALSNVGMPEVELFSQRTPFQDGEQYLGSRFKSRKIIVGIYLYPGNRDMLYQKHQEVLAALNPQKGKGILKWVLNDGTTRYIDVYFSGGLTYNTDAQHAFMRQVDVIELTAMNPFWYNPLKRTEAFSMVQSSSFLLPMTLPFILPSSGIVVQQSVENRGDINASPIITVVGPGSNPIVRNVTTGEVTDINLSIAAGESIVIDTRFGVKSVVYNQPGGQSSVIGYMSSSSVFVGMLPGVNTIQCSMNNTTTDSRFEIEWYDYYLGV